MPKDSERTPEQRKAARRRNAPYLGVFIMACAFPPFINSFDNPQVAALRGVVVFRLLVAGSLFGFGLALLISALIIFRRE